MKPLAENDSREVARVALLGPDGSRIHLRVGKMHQFRGDVVKHHIAGGEADDIAVHLPDEHAVRDMKFKRHAATIDVRESNGSIKRTLGDTVL